MQLEGQRDVAKLIGKILQFLIAKAPEAKKTPERKLLVYTSFADPSWKEGGKEKVGFSKRVWSNSKCL